MRINALRSGLSAFIPILLLAVGAQGQATSAQHLEPRPPAFLSLRYDEDWSPLREPSRRTGPFDAAKYIPLGKHPGWYMSLGGEARIRFEGYRNASFGLGPQDDNGYWLQRYLLHADIHLGAHVRAFAQLQSAIEIGRNGGPRPTDENKLDVHQAFLDLSTSAVGGGLTLRLGRQEIEFGSARLISASEALNVRRSFDGARLIYKRGSWTVNAIAVKLTAAKRGLFDDVPEPAQTFWGVGLIRPRPAARGGWSLYYLGLDRKSARFDQGTGREVRQTIGSRFWGNRDNLDYNYELIGQWGSFAEGANRGAIRAYAMATDTGHTFRSAPFTPRLGVRFAIASGDRDPGDRRLQSFNPLFPGTAYAGLIALIGPTNTIELAPALRFVIKERVTVTADSALYWRERLNDGIYGINVNLQRPSGPSRARHIGTLPALRSDWQINRYLNVTAIYSHLFPGRYLRESPPGRPVDYFSTWMTFRF